MRLLNTATFQLEEFVDSDTAPPYAILSHTWGADEVTFKDLTLGNLEYQHKQGWSKITESSAYASKNGWEHIWIDTCCIDKSDISELSEAINSMFRWYESAQVCYAYLSDVTPLSSALPKPGKQTQDFRSSRWFRRGWTLQELLAPTFLEFLDSQWNPMGSREEWAAEIEAAAGIEVKDLANFQECCVATKLSWAANRQTTRVEDLAYCLLGLVGVNMPLIYGEGKRAFTRLQQELIRTSNDESIFLWAVTGGVAVLNTNKNVSLSGGDVGMPRIPRDDPFHIPVLASSPSDFAQSRGNVNWRFDKQRRAFSMTNGGLSMNAEVFGMPPIDRSHEPVYLIRLNCARALPPPEEKSPLVLFLRDVDNRITITDAGRVPNFFIKTRFAPQTWRDVDTGQWRSLGRQDILIANHASPVTDGWQDTTGLPIQIKICMPWPVTQTYQLAFWDSWKGAWDISGTLAEPRDFPRTLHEETAYIFVITVQGGHPARTGYRYVVIIKRDPRNLRKTLSCGLWLRSPIESDALRGLLDSDQDKPYPHTAPGAWGLDLPGPANQLVVLRTAAVNDRTVPSEPNSKRRAFEITVSTSLDLNGVPGLPAGPSSTVSVGLGPNDADMVDEVD